jgi:hypothetical protein
LKRSELRQAFGLVPTTGATRWILTGWIAGAASLLAMNALLVGAGARRWNPEGGLAAFGSIIILYLGQALVLGLLEEGLFRGLILGRFREVTGPAFSLVFTSVLFAAAHFLQPLDIDRSAPAWQTGLVCLGGLADLPNPRWKEFLGLFLVGAVLGTLRLKTGAIWLPLGVHTGWVWVRMVARKTLEEVDPVVDEHLLLFGTMRHYDGVAGWLALGLTLAILLIVLRRPVTCLQRGS